VWTDDARDTLPSADIEPRAVGDAKSTADHVRCLAYRASSSPLRRIGAGDDVARGKVGRGSIAQARLGKLAGRLQDRVGDRNHSMPRSRARHPSFPTPMTSNSCCSYAWQPHFFCFCCATQRAATLLPSNLSWTSGAGVAIAHSRSWPQLPVRAPQRFRLESCGTSDVAESRT
jgi:hypothetical protein